MLREMHLRRADVVSALAIITPVDKLSGRGLNVRKPAPMTLLAKKMGFEVSHVHDFSLNVKELPAGEWDLIVAVSFGHKITSAVLNQMKVGGLNIHPSLLPRHRGPAPLHRALLNDDKETGVSIQTIHPTEFDKGSVLMQSTPIPLVGMNFSSLYSTTSRMGASMLKDLLLNGYPGNAPPEITSHFEESYAGKVQKTETRIDWSTWTAERIKRWSDTVDPLWSILDGKLVKLSDLQRYCKLQDVSAQPGQIRLVQEQLSTHEDSRRESVLIARCQDDWVKIGKFTIAGKKERLGSDARDLADKQFEN